MAFRQLISVLGGPGSGNHGHSGRPGEVGGSTSQGGGEGGSSFRSSLKKELSNGKLPLYHEAPLSAYDSIVRQKKGLLSSDSAEDTNFATVGEPSGFVKGDKVIVRFQVPSSDLDSVVPDMRYADESELLKEHKGAHGADVAYNGKVPFSMIDQIQIVRGGKVVKTITNKPKKAAYIHPAYRFKIHSDLSVEQVGSVFNVVLRDNERTLTLRSFSILEHGEKEAQKLANAAHYAILSKDQPLGTPVDEREGVYTALETQTKGKSRVGGLKGVNGCIEGFQNLGGPGSGNHGHAGIPGQVGGSAAGGGSSAFDSVIASKQFTVPKQAEKSGAKLVWVDAKKFDQGFQKNKDQYIEEGGKNAVKTRNGDRYSDFATFFKETKEPIQVSEVVISKGENSEKGTVQFINGRHRYAYMRDQGATKIPVAFYENSDTMSIADAEKEGFITKGKD